MNQQLTRYMVNSQRARSLVHLHDSLRGNLTAAIDTSDMLRAGYVLSVSALDTYVHELVLEEMIKIYDGCRPTVPGYQRYRMTLGAFAGSSSLSDARSDVRSQIREQHSYLSFQHPDKIADAIRCVTDIKIWEEVGTNIGKDAKYVKDRLTLIVDRRNKIAHEADTDPTFGTLWAISSNDVLGAIDFLDAVAAAIDDIVSI